MEGGDLSNEVAPRLLVVWEGLLGLLPSKPIEAKFSVAVRFRRWDAAVGCFALNDMLARRIWDVTWRVKYRVDILTYLGADFAEALERRVDADDLPCRVVHDDPQHLSRRLAYMQHVAAIYDPDPRHQFLYGGKGRILSPATPDLLGRF